MVGIVVLTAITALVAGSALAQSQPLVQATKPVCKATAREATSRPPVCHGGQGRLTPPDVCFCADGDMLVELPACWQDGRPAMHRRGEDFTGREYESLVACEDLDRGGRR